MNQPANQAANQPASAYFMEERHDPSESHTLSVLVQNEPGVLARVIGLFSGRGYNIESLTVSETENQKHVSRITIVTTGTPMVIEQIKHQLDRMVPVYRVVDMTLTGRSIERELAMVKLRGTGEHRVESLRLAEAFRARVIDATLDELAEALQRLGRVDLDPLRLEHLLCVLARLTQVTRTAQHGRYRHGDADTLGELLVEATAALDGA